MKKICAISLFAVIIALSLWTCKSDASYPVLFSPTDPISGYVYSTRSGINVGTEMPFPFMGSKALFPSFFSKNLKYKPIIGVAAEFNENRKLVHYFNSNIKVYYNDKTGVGFKIFYKFYEGKTYINEKIYVFHVLTDFFGADSLTIPYVGALGKESVAEDFGSIATSFKKALPLLDKIEDNFFMGIYYQKSRVDNTYNINFEFNQNFILISLGKGW